MYGDAVADFNDFDYKQIPRQVKTPLGLVKVQLTSEPIPPGWRLLEIGEGYEIK